MTVLPLPNFTVTGNLREILRSPTVDGEIGTQVWDDAYVILTCNHKGIVVWDGTIFSDLPAPKGFVDPLTGDIEIDDRQSQLLANHPGLNVSGVQWECQIKTSPSNVVARFWFDAPSDGGTVNLATVAHVPPLIPHPVSAMSINDLMTLANDPESAFRTALTGRTFTLATLLG